MKHSFKEEFVNEISRFLNQPFGITGKNGWFTEKLISVYLRRQNYFFCDKKYPDVICVANVNVLNMGNGVYTDFLRLLTELAVDKNVLIENDLAGMENFYSSLGLVKHTTSGSYNYFGSLMGVGNALKLREK